MVERVEEIATTQSKVDNIVELLEAKAVEIIDAHDGDEQCPFPTINFEGRERYDEGLRVAMIVMHHGISPKSVRLVWDFCDSGFSQPYWEMTFHPDSLPERLACSPIY